MKTVAITRFADPETNDKGQIEVVDFPMPSPGPTDVLVKVAYASICGSDPHILAIGKSIGWGTPFGLGHEVSGTVVDLGPLATVTGLKIGDKVTGNFFKACGVCERCRNGQPNMCVECFKGWNAAMDLALTLSKEELPEIIAFSSLQIRALEWVLEAANVTPEDVADYASSMNRELLKDRLRRATKEAEDRLHDHPEDSGTPAKEGIDS